jgi:CMP-2-keto-3-deoxyoctulosonic acid synthetase
MDTKKIIEYVDARFCGDLDKALDIKLKLSGNTNKACHICSKINQKGKAVVNVQGDIVWECLPCINAQYIRENTLFGRRAESG